MAVYLDYLTFHFSGVRFDRDNLFAPFCLGQSYHLLFGQVAQVPKTNLPKNRCDCQKRASPRIASAIVEAYIGVVNRCGRIRVWECEHGWPLCAKSFGLPSILSVKQRLYGGGLGC